MRNNPPFLFETILGKHFRALPHPIRRMHQFQTSGKAEGYASVKRGKNPVSKLFAIAFRLPIESRKMFVSIEFEAKDNEEKWSRNFGGRRFSTRLRPGNSPGGLVESFGPFSFCLNLTPEKDKVIWNMEGFRFLGIPLPNIFSPKTLTFESVNGGKYNFYVRVDLPFSGMLIEYKGWLKIVE